MERDPSNFERYASVILDVSINKMLDYGIPTEYLEKIKRGVRVEVPVRGHIRKGYVFELKKERDFPRILPIANVISEEEVIPENLLQLALWIARYYCAPLGQVLRLMVPATIRKDMQHKQQLFVMCNQPRDKLRKLCSDIRNKSSGQASVLDVMLKVKKGVLLSELLELAQTTRSPVNTLVKKGALVIDIVRVDRSPLINEDYFKTKPKALNTDQQEAFDKIIKSLEEHRFETHLLHGVTGSGKTEIYLQAIDKALKIGIGTIMLVPEISLTAQTIERFRSRFEGHIAILHHRLSHGERFDEWHKIRRGKAQIVIGARSAIFSPVVNLGLIIVDEEHETSYKQNEKSPCYHARDVAVIRGKMTNSTIILGSATPSLESYYNAETGKYTLSKLHKRANTAASIPTVTIVDMKKEFEKAKGYTNFSDLLLEGIKKRQKLGEQTILFLNRRGYHTTLMCKQCNHVVKCQHCDVSLTFHLGQNTLACHLCGFTLSPPSKQCSACKKGETMKYRGVGTELVEKSLHAILPDIRSIRVDADTTRHKGSHQRLLHNFGTGKADVLIGTQMIAKGLHFPQVTLVGVINSDASLNIPDFRSSETVFQLITQVAGRAGRGDIPGKVIIQTCMPENMTIQLAAKQDYESFYKEEIKVRKLFRYPPVRSMVKLSFSGKDPAKTTQTAFQMRHQLAKRLPPDFELNPVIPAGYAKVKDKYRFQFFIRGPSVYPITEAIKDLRNEKPPPSHTKVSIDVNPTSTFF